MTSSDMVRTVVLMLSFSKWFDVPHCTEYIILQDFKLIFCFFFETVTHNAFLIAELLIFHLYIIINFRHLLDVLSPLEV